MNTNNKREFSMKYCPNLEDHVVVLTSGKGSNHNKICLSSHLCHTDTRISCGQALSLTERKDGSVFF